MKQVPKLRKKTLAERGPLDPEGLAAALNWDKLLEPEISERPLMGELVIPQVISPLTPETDHVVPLDPQSEPEEKGGPTSGNWGHTGAPGRGGSSGGSGFAAIGATQGMSRQDVIARRTLTKKPDFPISGAMSTKVGMAKYKAQVAARDPEALQRARDRMQRDLKDAESRNWQWRKETGRELDRPPEEDAAKAAYQKELGESAENVLRMTDPLAEDRNPEQIRQALWVESQLVSLHHEVAPHHVDADLQRAVDKLRDERNAAAEAFGGTPATPEQLEAIRQFEWDHRNSSKEYSRVIAPDGTTVLNKTSGKTDAVVFTNDELYDIHGNLLVHNHPSGSSFSPGDAVMLMANGGQGIVAVGTMDRGTETGSSYRYTLLPDGDMHRFFNKGIQQREGYTAHILRMDRDVTSEMWTRIQSNSITPDDAGNEHWHTVFTRLDANMQELGIGKLNYSREAIDPFDPDWPSEGRAEP